MQTSENILIIDLENALSSVKLMAEHLIRQKLFHSYCTIGYSRQEEYTKSSDMVIIDRDLDLMFFFSFANTFAEYLNK